MDKFHTSILVDEVVEALHVKRGSWYVDATLGGGGHTEAIVRAGGKVLGIDVDRDAIGHATERLQGIDGIVLRQRSYSELELILKEEGIGNVEGVVFDLGVSSHQFDTPERGFSYRFSDAPLDMRFGDDKKETASELLSRVSEEELYEIIATYGEEECARSIAHALVSARKIKKFERVRDLNNALESILGGGHEHFRMLSRVYQALRMAVNDEMKTLQEGLIGAEQSLSSGGVLMALTFHSIEDRIVKRFLRTHTFSRVTKKPKHPSQEEYLNNSRSRSVKMRVGKKL